MSPRTPIIGPRWNPACWPWPLPALAAWLLAWCLFGAGVGLGPDRDRQPVAARQPMSARSAALFRAWGRGRGTDTPAMSPRTPIIGPRWNPACWPWPLPALAAWLLAW
ncbi:MAG: hypothetical protein ACK5IH_10335, partial [Betaproteobacteria bacterium]